MRSMVRGIATLAVAGALAACSGGGGATTAPGGATQAASGPCMDSTGAAAVNATVADFKWSQPITAKVGDVITWTNNDTAAHKVELDDKSCAMSKSIAGSGGTQSLVFTKAGTYPFHCAIHDNMPGTITIS